MIDYTTATADEIVNDCKRRAGEYVSRLEYHDEHGIQEYEYTIAALTNAISELIENYERDTST